tara:strand:- start:790 stop:1017 length:228 start_codon:yes stop_codon:yes gene_type:complete
MVHELKGMIEKINIVERDDGSADLELEVTEKFVAWFKKTQGLKRWSQKRFEKWIHEGIVQYLNEALQEDTEGLKE